MTLKALIVDDESLGRRGLKLRLADIEGVEVVGECSNGSEALAAIPELAPDLVFLDIQMPGMDGFDVVRALQADDMPMIIFCTAFDHYAVDAFKIHAVDYLLKPIEDTRLREAVARAHHVYDHKNAVADKAQLLDVIGRITQKDPSQLDEWLSDEDNSNQYPEKLAVKDGGNITLVPVADIDWVDAAGDYMCLHVNGVIHVMRITMKALEEQLNPGLFQRVHRSTIVNIKRIEKISSHINGEYHLILHSGDKLKMSRSYKDKVSTFLK
ncbi:LytTR family DNA-binding domain-containing protein [Simiduia sp. 21SJ11W-1]|uniref:LytR/AlgR family response regulator transcription factor n=1 Tax=Simiduia sp. 21SJ11W-1 TaxID=2909669 RepID=UPI00209DABD9|nr:LytTR family DNA-binding domain-containing protein [Simiduia sp. 21SJ11W-1]UTA48043.1 LytTR family DNA-binding domain-containing protein [Simiduia sp. 21SJ11W-1]